MTSKLISTLSVFWCTDCRTILKQLEPLSFASNKAKMLRSKDGAIFCRKYSELFSKKRKSKELSTDSCRPAFYLLNACSRFFNFVYNTIYGSSIKYIIFYPDMDKIYSNWKRPPLGKTRYRVWRPYHRCQHSVYNWHKLKVSWRRTVLLQKWLNFKSRRMFP